MLPSLGFFGGWWCDVLEVATPTNLVQLEIKNVNDKPMPLELKGVRFGKGDSTFKVSSDQVQNELSSLRPDGKSDPDAAWTLDEIKTPRELHPWWRARFSEPLDVDRVFVFNRPDKYGRRSQTLRITTWDSAGNEAIVYDSTTPAYLEEVLATISKYAGFNVGELKVTNVAQAQAWRSEVVSRLAANLTTGVDMPTKQEWNYLAALIPTESRKGIGTRLEGKDWFLLAYGLTAQIHRTVKTHGSFKPYSGVLNTTAHLERLIAEFEPAAKALNCPTMIFTRHGIVPASQLKDSFPALTKMMREAEADLASQGSRTMLAYGSLLGAVRDGALIAHDDDFDIFCTIEAETEAEFEAKRSTIIDYLKNRGWQVKLNGKHYNFHISRPEDPEIILDVFALWMGPGFARAHMEGMVRRNISREWFEDTKMVEIEGETLPAPIGSEAFLAERYGEGWKVPDPYHDWIWQLDDRVPLDSNTGNNSATLGSKVRKTAGRIKRGVGRRVRKS